MILKSLTSTLKWLARKICGLSRSEWVVVLDKVIEAKGAFADNEDRRVFVRDSLRAIAPHVGAWAINLGVELVVGYAKRKGEI